MQSDFRSEPFNPYAVPAGDTMGHLSAQSQVPVVIAFSGRIEERQLRRFYKEPYHFGCLVVLLLAGSLVWATVLGAVYGIFAGLIVCTVAAVSGFWFRLLFLSDWRFKNCCDKRPWLLGPAHGSLSSGRLTVWHNDVCIQTNDHSMFDSSYRGSVFFPRRGYPLAWVPSTCFYEQQWVDLHGELRAPRSMPLIIEAPPEDASVCAVPIHRLYFLHNRMRGLRWRLSAEMFWVAIAFGVMSSLFFQSLMNVNPLLYLLVPLVIWLAMETIRTVWLRWSLHAQFESSPELAYVAKDKAACEGNPWLQMTSWFNREAVLASDANFWIRLPLSRVESYRIHDSGIEFVAREISLLFHREGFDGPEAWRSACAKVQSLIPQKQQT